MVMLSLPETQFWPGFRVDSLAVPRVVHLVALRAVVPVQIPALAYPAPLEVAQEALPAVLQAVSPDPRHRFAKKTGMSWPHTSRAFLFAMLKHSPPRGDFH